MIVPTAPFVRRPTIELDEIFESVTFVSLAASMSIPRMLPVILLFIMLLLFAPKDNKSNWSVVIESAVLDQM